MSYELEAGIVLILLRGDLVQLLRALELRRERSPADATGDTGSVYQDRAGRP